MTNKKEQPQSSLNNQMDSINDWLIGALNLTEILIGPLLENTSGEEEEISSTRCGTLEDGLQLGCCYGEKLHRQLQRIVDQIG